MTELQDIGMANGAGFSPAPDSSASGGFIAADLWSEKKSYYNLKPHVNAEGHIPAPSQTKIDRYEKEYIILSGELERLQREIIKPYEDLAEQAEDLDAELRRVKLDRHGLTSDEELEKNKQEIDRLKKDRDKLEKALKVDRKKLDATYKKRDVIFEQFRDAAAPFCGGHPTREQLAGLPSNVLIPFVHHLRELINPEV